MVHNIIKHSLLPFSNSRLKTLNSQPITGRGMGSVLLRSGGGGAGSSYSDIDDYIHTTGINPYSRGTTRSTGSGLEKLGEKLSKLNISTVSGRPKKRNIQISI
jgi:hypothetical protein